MDFAITTITTYTIHSGCTFNAMVLLRKKPNEVSKIAS